MNYIYPPLYKYIAFIIIFFMFMRYYKVITQSNYLIVALVATIILILLDYFLIYNHPNLIATDSDVNSDTEIALKRLIETESESDSNYNDDDFY